jgi:hypothetical protein
MGRIIELPQNSDILPTLPDALRRSLSTSPFTTKVQHFTRGWASGRQRGGSNASAAIGEGQANFGEGRGDPYRLGAHAMMCLWCQADFEPRRGGSPQRFCCSDHRARFWAAARQWAERAVTAGVLTVHELRKGPAEACTLVLGAKDAMAEVSPPKPSFDRQRPFGEIWGPGGFEGYEQDGRRFNPGGDPV